MPETEDNNRNENSNHSIVIEKTQKYLRLPITKIDLYVIAIIAMSFNFYIYNSIRENDNSGSVVYYLRSLEQSYKTPCGRDKGNPCYIYNTIRDPIYVSIIGR